MGSKYKYLIITFILLSSLASSQAVKDFSITDSITYKYYIEGRWDSLINAGRPAIRSGMDYKYLRQRLGYAFFSKGDYQNAAIQFEKALLFDSWDTFTAEYIYYSYLNTGKEEYAGVLLKRLDTAQLKRIGISRFRPVTYFDVELDYKYAATAVRSDPLFGRAGIGSSLGYRFKLYQSVSNYYTLINPGTDSRFRISQLGYYARLSWNASLNLMVRAAWHHHYATSGNAVYKDDLFRLSLAPSVGRMSLEAYGSVLRMQDELFWQAGAGAGYVLPGRADFYIKGTLSALAGPGGEHLVFNPAAGLKLFRGAWLEGNITAGEMHGYNDFHGLYVYNTYDPVIFRAGGTLSFYIGRNIAFWFNYSYEKKRYFEDKSLCYNQFSYLGGLRWKL